MLRREEDLFGFALRGGDGTIGRIHDFLTDTETWTVRYLAVRTGDWPFPRCVAISPCVVESCISKKRQYVVSMTKAQVEDSLPLELDRGLSWQQRDRFAMHFSWNGRAIAHATNPVR